MEISGPIFIGLKKLCCVLQFSTVMTRATCDIIGGYFSNIVPSYSMTISPDDSFYWTTTGTSFSSPATTSPTTVCYYESFDCPGYSYNSQCYSDVASTLSCSTCSNIGGDFTRRYDCYFNSFNCSYLSVGGQCHTNRYRKLLNHCRHFAVFSRPLKCHVRLSSSFVSVCSLILRVYCDKTAEGFH